MGTIETFDRNMFTDSFLYFSKFDRIKAAREKWKGPNPILIKTLLTKPANLSSVGFSEERTHILSLTRGLKPVHHRLAKILKQKLPDSVDLWSPTKDPIVKVIIECQWLEDGWEQEAEHLPKQQENVTLQKQKSLTIPTTFVSDFSLCNVHQLIQSRCWENLDWMLAQRLNASTNQTRPLIAANRSNQPGCIIRYTNGEINIRIIWRKIFIWKMIGTFSFNHQKCPKWSSFYIRWSPAKFATFFRDFIGVL